MLEAIVFDFDGVIVDTEPLHYRAFIRVLEPMGIRFDYAHYKQHYIGYDDRDGFRAICAAHDKTIGDDRLAELIANKADVFEQVVSLGVEPIPGALGLIRSVSKQVPIAICSGALRRDIELILSSLDDGCFAGVFGAIVSAEEVVRSKPDPESYRRAAERLGVPCGSCLAVEDTQAGIASANRAGMFTLAVTTSFPAADLTEADRIVESLEGLDFRVLREWFEESARDS